MTTRQPRVRALVLTVLASLLAHASAAAGWMWDVDQDRIDDRIPAVESGGLAAAHVGGLLTAKRRFAVLNESAPFHYGVYIGYDHAPTDDDAAALSALGVPVQVRYRSIPYIRSAITYAQALQVAALPGVVRIETIPMMYAVNDVATSALRGRDAGGALSPGVWKDLGFTGKGVTVAILDTGVNDEAYLGYPGHESLRGKFVGGGNFYSGQPELNTPLEASENPSHVQDPEATYHGTHVAGTAIGSGGPEGNLAGGEPGMYAGVAPDARLVDIKALSDAGAGFGAADGLDWLIHHRNDDWGLTGADTVYHGVDIASMSLGGTDNSDGSDASSAAVNAAHRAGIVVLVATGNDGNTGWIASPSAADFAISVGSLTDNNTVERADDIVADYSNEGPRLSDGDGDAWDEMKPSVLGNGTGIMSALGDPTTDGTRYHHINGTSMATPAVAGVAALILSANPNLSPDEVRRILENTAEHRTTGGKQPPSAVDPFDVDANYHPSWGFGAADACGAVLEALNAFQTQIVRIRASGQLAPAGIRLEWWTQREYALASFVIDRAPEVLGGPGAWTSIHQMAVADPQIELRGVPNRHAYEWIDLDSGLDPDAAYWYRVRWTSTTGLSRTGPAVRARIQKPPVVARVEFSWTHNYSDGDLDVRFGTGTDPEHPVWFRQAEGAPAADSVVTLPGVAYTGTQQHFFHVDLTAEDGVATFLPPGAANPWFLQVKEGGYINTNGRVNHFTVTWFGPGGPTVFAAPNPVTPTVEKTATVFWIPLDPVTSLNHAPVLSPIGSRVSGEGLTVNFVAAATDADDDLLAYSASGLPAGSTFDPGTGAFQWTPGFADAGEYVVTLVVSDGAFPVAAADTEQVAISVEDREPSDNRAPLLDPLLDRAGFVGHPMSFRVRGRDYEGGALLYSVTGLPAGVSFDPVTGAFAWTPAESQIGGYLASFRATDPGGLHAQQTILIRVARSPAELPEAQPCSGNPETLAGVIGMGTDPGEKSVTYHPFTVPAGTQRISGSLAWFGAPLVDLDFYLLDADSNAVQSSASLASPEVLQYDLPEPGVYLWQVVAFTNPDTANYTIESNLCVSAVTAVEIPHRSSGVELAAPRPNPARGACAIQFDLPREADATLRVYDLTGRLVRILADGRLTAGRHTRRWDGRTASGSRTPAGVYFYRLEARTAHGTEVVSRKAVRIE